MNRLKSKPANDSWWVNGIIGTAAFAFGVGLMVVAENNWIEWGGRLIAVVGLLVISTAVQSQDTK